MKDCWDKSNICKPVFLSLLTFLTTLFNAHVYNCLTRHVKANSGENISFREKIEGGTEKFPVLKVPRQCPLVFLVKLH
jgi:hypothetical protein